MSPSGSCHHKGNCLVNSKDTAMRHVVPVQALALQETYEAEDEMDDAASDAREAQQKRSRAAAIASGAPLPDTSAYFHERLYWGEHASALA